MKKILFCTDLSKSCQGLCGYIAEWVRGTNIVVDVIHSYDPDLVNIPEANMPQLMEFHTQREEEIIAEMEDFLSKLPLQNKGKYHLIESADRALAIRKTARLIRADLIVTGLRDRYTLMDKLIGSTSAKLLDNTNPPLLVLPYGREYAPIQNILYTTEAPSKNMILKREEDALSWIYTHLDKEELPSIHLLHVTKDKTPTTEEEHPILPMRFTATYSTDIVMGVLDHLESSPSDLLVVHHKEKNLWDRIHKSSVSKNLLYKAQMPTLFT